MRHARRRTRERDAAPGWREALDPRLLGAFAGGLALVAVAAAALSWLQDPATLPLEAVELEGRLDRVEGSAVRRAVAPYVDRGFFAVDVAAVREAVEALPWVAEVRVRRIWPDRLGIEVTEHRPLARWADGGVVSREGELFHPEPETVPEGLPSFQGPEALAGDMADRFWELGRSLESTGLALQGLAADGRRAWRLELDNGIEVVLGRDAWRDRLQRFLASWPETLQPMADRIEVVDLRYTNGFSVRWKGEPPSLSGYAGRGERA
ncbi:MAG: cell division protein FtsQ/DivIB [Thiohalospira sp.]